jgi:hypothetical protein
MVALLKFAFLHSGYSSLNSTPIIIEDAKSAPVRSTPERSAFESLASDTSAFESLAFERLAFERLANAS